MKNIYIIVFILFVQNVYSQNYLGYAESNYSGLIGNRFNPANIADNRLRIDFTILGQNFNLANNYMYFDGGDLSIKPPFFSEGAGINYKDIPDGEGINMNLQLNFDIGIMFSINEDIGIGLYVRPRASMWGNGLSQRFIDEMIGVSDIEDFSDTSFSVSDENMFNTAMVWNEFVFNYGQVIIKNKEHFLKAGVDIKILQGVGAYYAKAEGLSFDFDSESDTEFTNASGEVEIAYSEGINIDDVISKPSNLPLGVGFGFGVVYEWRPNWKNHQYSTADEENIWRRDENKYKLKVGVSVLDIGSIKYSMGEYSTNLDIINPSFSSNDFPSDNLEELYNFSQDPENGIFKAGERPDDLKLSLPTKLNLFVDYNIYKGFYVSMLSSMSMLSSTNYLSVSEYSYYSLSPRFESKYFDVSLPVNYSDISGLNWGLSLRTGGFFIGTSDLSSLLSSSEISGASVYFGFRLALKH